MPDDPKCQSPEQVVLPPPTAQTLPELRATAKRAKPPSLPTGAHWSNSKIGSYRTKGSTEGIVVTWRTADGPERTEPFKDLSTNDSLETLRLELGWMIANMLRVEPVRMLREIPGPKEAMAEANFYHREEARWRYWALFGEKPSPKKPKKAPKA